MRDIHKYTFVRTYINNRSQYNYLAYLFRLIGVEVAGAAALRVCDVPGFGQSSEVSEMYEQSIKDDSGGNKNKREKLQWVTSERK